MIIKNLTSKVQQLKVEELVGGREFTIYVKENGKVDIDGVYIPHIESLSHIFEVLDSAIPQQSIQESHEEIHEVFQESHDEQKNQEDEKEETHEEITDKFICDVCGSEFASARGLASHKNRVHIDEANK